MYYRLEPWGDEWHLGAEIAATNLEPWSKQPIRRDHFLPRWAASSTPWIPEQQSDEEIEAILTQALGPA